MTTETGQAAPASRSRLPFAAAVVCALIFLPTVRYRFVNWDDDSYIISNTFITRGGAQTWAIPLTEAFEGFYGPVFWWILKVEYSVFGFSGWGFHLVSVAVHAANCALVLSLLRQLGYGRREAAVGALLWAAHPLRVESVAWVTAQKDLFSALFCLLAAREFFPIRDCPDGYNNRIIGEKIIRAGRPLRTTGYFLLALASKPSVAAWPFALLAFDLAFFTPASGLGAWKSQPGKLFKRAIPCIVMLCMAVPFVGGIFQAHESLGSVDSSLIGRPAHTLLLSAYLLSFHVVKTLLPIGLSAFHVAPWPVELSRPVFILSLVCVAACAIAFIAALKRNRGAAAGMAVYALCLLPSLQIIPAGQVIAERYSYLPAVGIAVLTAELHAFIRSRCEISLRVPFSTAALSIIGFFLVLLTWRRMPVWHDSVSLWTDAARKAPESWVVRYKLGEALAQADYPREALPNLEYAALRCGNEPAVLHSLVRAYMRNGQEKKATMAIFRWATILEGRGMEPSAIGAEAFQICRKIGLPTGDLDKLIQQYLKARETVRSGDMKAAKPLLDALTRDWPELVEGQMLQFHAAMNSGDYAQAGEWLNLWGETAEDEPNYALLKVELLDRQGRGKEAVSLCRATLLRCHCPPLAARLAALLADSGRFDEALKLSREALRQAPDDVSVKRSSAWVLHKAGRHQEAISLLAACPGPGTTDPVTAYKQALILAGGGGLVEAAAWLKDAVNRASPDAPWLPEAKRMLEAMR
ncbi:MAG TPA: tetratricopeptide repeat protein [Candidatus Brocadiia bacterium]|nr:tetratricopeptide repeat protein [Candidatus Brocadiia bacterium]